MLPGPMAYVVQVGGRIASSWHQRNLWPCANGSQRVYATMCTIRERTFQTSDNMRLPPSAAS